MAKSGYEVAKGYVSIIPSLEGSQSSIKSQLTGMTEPASQEAGESAGSTFGASFASAIGTAATAIATATVAVVSAAVAGITELTTEAVNSYGEYEQLVGGVEKIFGDEFADTVISNANRAFETAGMSANEYMETVTGFSASLIQSLGGDTEQAVAYADMAISDMSDNANTFGTDISSIQNAYSGFAKGNYTMLDNLKLGYGGTASEMERLLEDADALSDSFELQYDDAGNLVYGYADVVEAIHIVQDELNITGTTANEASGTIQGSLSALEASWTNLITGLGDSSADLGTLIDNVVANALNVVNNIKPVAIQAISGISTLVQEVAPILEEELPTLVQEILPDLVTAVSSLISSVASVLPSLISSILPDLVDCAIDALDAFVNAIVDNADALIEAVDAVIDTITTKLLNSQNIGKLTQSAIDIVLKLADGLISAFPDLAVALTEVITEVISVLSSPDNLSRILVMVTDLVEMLSTTLVQLAPTLTNVILPTLWNIAQSLWIALPDIIEAIFTVGINYILTKWSAILGIFGVKFDDIKSFFESFGIDINNIVESLVVNLIIWFEDAWDFLSTWFGNAVEGLGNFVADIIEWVVNLNNTIARTIATFFSNLWNTVVSWTNSIKNTITSWVNTIRTTISNWVTNLKNAFSTAFDNIKNKISSIVTQAQSLVTNCIDKIKELPDKVKAIGKNLVEGLWNGINDKISWVKNKISNMGSQITDAIKGVFGIASPSKLWRDEIGTMLALGLGEGFSDTMGDVKDDMVDSMNGLTGNMTAEVSAYANTSAGLLGSTTNYNGGGITMNIYGSEGQNVNDLANAIALKLEEMTSRRGAVYA